MTTTEECLLRSAAIRSVRRGETKAEFLHLIRAAWKEDASRLWDEANTSAAKLCA